MFKIEDACPDISKEAKMLFLPKPKIAKKGEHFGQLYNQLEKCGDICKWILNRIQVMIKIYRIHGQKFFTGTLNVS